jgi:hypothetical protein
MSRQQAAVRASKARKAQVLSRAYRLISKIELMEAYVDLYLAEVNQDATNEKIADDLLERCEYLRHLAPDGRPYE